jgi:hypothetical protein
MQEQERWCWLLICQNEAHFALAHCHFSLLLKILKLKLFIVSKKLIPELMLI